MSTTSDERYKRLNVEHPLYTAHSPFWELVRDVVGDSVFEVERYLPRGLSEDDDIYEFRCQLARFIPDTPGLLDKVIGGIYSRAPMRDLGSFSADLEGFIKNVDGSRTSYARFVEDVCFRLLAYGTIRVLINSYLPDGTTTSNPGGILTMADRKNLQLRAIDYSPLAVINWAVDADGMLTLAVIKEMRRDLAPNGKTAEFHRFHRWTRETVEWTEFMKGDSGWEVVESASGMKEHGLGFVPMIMDFFPRKVAPGVGSGYAKNSAHADVQKFQAEADLQNVAHVHAHPVMWVKTTEELQTLGIGANSYIKLRPDIGEDVGYVDMPSTPVDLLKYLIELKQEQIRRSTGTDPLGRDSASTFQASGRARSWSFTTTEARLLGRVAERMEVIEYEILNACLRWLGRRPSAAGTSQADVFDGAISYSKSFAADALDRMLEDRSLIHDVNSPTLWKEYDKQIAAAIVGSDEDLLARCIREIEANPIKDSEEVGLDPAMRPGAEFGSGFQSKPSGDVGDFEEPSEVDDSQ